MRFKNFHKSKPIVQNVKTNSVNEGIAPKTLTMANDISEWNPGISHDQLNEAGEKGKGKGNASASAPTSYSEESETRIVITDSKRAIKKSLDKIKDLKQRVQANQEKFDNQDVKSRYAELENSRK